MAERSMSGGIDTSIYNQRQEQPNLLAQLSGLVGVQNAMQSGEIQAQALAKLKAEQSAGQNFLSAIDPTTGQIDTNKLGGFLKANPNAAFVAPEMIARQQSLQGGQIANQQARTNVGVTQQGHIATGIAGLASKPDLTAQDLIAFTRQQQQAGVIPADRAQTIEAEINAVGGDRRKLREYAYNHYATVTGAGAMAPAQVGVTREGAPVIGTAGGLARASTASPQTGVGIGGKAAPTGIVVSQAPGVAEAQTKTAAASAEQGIALQKQADGVPVRKGMLANLEDDLDKFTSGPKADWSMVAKSFANRNLLPQGMQFDPQSIASQEAFNKQATQLAQQQFAALGGTGTDNQLSSSYKANPNEALSKLGNKQIIQLLKGNEDALAAKNKAWQDWQRKNGPNDYAGFQQEFNKTYNPRVYQAQYMTPEQINDMRKNMSPADQAQFLRDYKTLRERGDISPGGANAR
jgi:hypothetical protein